MRLPSPNQKLTLLHKLTLILSYEPVKKNTQPSETLFASQLPVSKIGLKAYDSSSRSDVCSNGWNFLAQFEYIILVAFSEKVLRLFKCFTCLNVFTFALFKTRRWNMPIVRTFPGL